MLGVIPFGGLGWPEGNETISGALFLGCAIVALAWANSPWSPSYFALRASVYKSHIRNFTTNSKRREDFVVGIGYDDSINGAQEIVWKVLAEPPAVLNVPEPSVLMDSLERSTLEGGGESLAGGYRTLSSEEQA